MQNKRKPIKLQYGARKRLAEICGVSEAAVWNAMHWKADTPTQALIRKRAKELGLIRRF